MRALFVAACLTCVFAWAENSDASDGYYRIATRNDRHLPERPVLNDEEIVRLAVDVLLRHRAHVNRPIIPPEQPALRRPRNDVGAYLDKTLAILIILLLYAIVLCGIWISTGAFLRTISRR
jgi:hypothetical protein